MTEKYSIDYYVKQWKKWDKLFPEEKQEKVKVVDKDAK